MIHGGCKIKWIRRSSVIGSLVTSMFFLILFSQTVSAQEPVFFNIQLRQSIDQVNWGDVDGVVETGFTMILDPTVPWYYMDIKYADTNVPLAEGFYGFNLTAYPSGFFQYWEERGVNESSPPGSWQAHMWQIINGNAPIFYIYVQANQEMHLIDGLMREYEEVRESLKLFSEGVLYTQKPLRDLFVVAAKLVLGDKLYPELANIPFLGPYNDRVISEVQRLRELREKISEKIVEVADEILKIETEFRVKKCKDDEGKPVYRVEQARWDISPKRPFVPSLEYLAKTYLTGGLDDVKRCIQMQESRQPVEGIHSYIMDEVAEEIREKAEKRKYAKRGKRRTDETMTNIQDDCIAVPRKLLEKMLEEILEMERILGDYRRPSKCAVKKLVMRGSSSS